MKEEQKQQENTQTGESTSPSPNSVLSGILGNALNSSLQYKKETAGLETKRCPNCSAARPADTDLQHCAYCGHKFY